MRFRGPLHAASRKAAADHPATDRSESLLRNPRSAADREVQFVRDLGLIEAGSGGLEISNPIYREVVPRALTEIMELSIALPRPSYLNREGRLDFDLLLADFRSFWRRHAESFLGLAPYSEAAAQLVFMAFLQKVVNTGGIVEREYATGRGRIDLLVRYPAAPSAELAEGRWAVELKVWRDSTPVGQGLLDPLSEGIEQLAGYLARLNLDQGYLLLFDDRSDAPPLPERISTEEVQYDGRKIGIWRL